MTGRREREEMGKFIHGLDSNHKITPQCPPVEISLVFGKRVVASDSLLVDCGVEVEDTSVTFMSFTLKRARR